MVATQDPHPHADTDQRPAITDLLWEIGDLSVGLGLLTFILAPFAIPFLLLLALTLVPFIVLGAIAGILATPVLLIRAVSQHRRPAAVAGTGPRQIQPEPSPRPAAAARRSPTTTRGHLG
jgi:hypothetical protein